VKKKKKKKDYATNEFFPVFIDFSTLLSSIQGFPDASEALENQVNAEIAVGEVCSVIGVFFFFLWRLKLLGYVLNSRICD